MPDMHKNKLIHVGGCTECITGEVWVIMKVVIRPIETIVAHSKEGLIRPEKYRIMEDGETTVVQIYKILTRSELETDGCRELIFGWQGVINGYMKNFELKYRVPVCQ